MKVKRYGMPALLAALLAAVCVLSACKNEVSGKVTDSESSGIDTSGVNYQLNYSLYGSDLHAAAGINTSASGFSALWNWDLKFDINHALTEGTVTLKWSENGTTQKMSGSCQVDWPVKYTFTLNGHNFVGNIVDGSDYWDIKIYTGSGTFVCDATGVGGITPGH